MFTVVSKTYAALSGYSTQFEVVRIPAVSLQKAQVESGRCIMTYILFAGGDLFSSV